MMAAPIATPDEKIEADKPETQADAAKDGSAPLACSFMKCPKDRPYCQMGSCVAKKDAKGGAATGGYDFSKFTKSYAGGKDSKKGDKAGFDYSKFTKGGKGGKGGFDYSKFTKGTKKGGKGGFDYSKFTKGGKTKDDA